MYTIDYLALMRQLKLSVHPHQLVRRLTKYPAHIKCINGVWCVTPQYAQLLEDFKAVNQKQKEVQHGNV